MKAKNFIRDLLQVVDHLYGKTFEEASEFSRAKKGTPSLVEFAEKTFGADDGRQDAQGGGTLDRRVDQHAKRGRASRWL